MDIQFLESSTVDRATPRFLSSTCFATVESVLFLDFFQLENSFYVCSISASVNFIL